MIFKKSNFSAKRTVKIVRSNDGPAVSFDKIQKASIDLAKKATAASASLARTGLMGVRGQGILLLDHSGSMRSDYRNGDVQTLTERAVARYVIDSSNGPNCW